MSVSVIPLTVVSVNNNPVTSNTQLFVVSRMRDIIDNQNHGQTAYQVDLPGDSQFAYYTEEASDLKTKYTVNENLAAILALINPVAP